MAGEECAFEVAITAVMAFELLALPQFLDNANAQSLPAITRVELPPSVGE
jgi:hypothetical protein